MNTNRNELETTTNSRVYKSLRKRENNLCSFCRPHAGCNTGRKRQNNKKRFKLWRGCNS